MENNLTSSLNGLNTLICGGTSGIGKATAMEFSNVGANVTFFARNEEKLKQTLSLLSNNGSQNHQYLVGDFDDSNNIKQTIDTHISSGNQYHILINNSGGPKGGPIGKANPEEFVVGFNRHLICNHIIFQALHSGMKEFNYGRVINIISTSVKQPLNGLGVSNTIRGAVANWAKTLANELGPYNITVNNVLPGATNTGRLQEIIKNKATKLNLSEKEIENQMASQVPLKRIAEPIEVANAVVFLASNKASYINGVNLPVDGGRTKSL